MKEEPGDSVTPLAACPTAVEGALSAAKGGGGRDECRAHGRKRPPEDDEPGDEPDAPKRKGPATQAEEVRGRAEPMRT
ncbi:MAG: hypothetical protein QY326_03225 [Bdellovibrionota bacterium]|nr:MAG: hypothetical protein QY326_03225 [Bdellovibrionota bacterium]